MNPRRDNPRIGFTLVELMVVFGIITILISLLIPAVTTSRESARQAVCQSNLHQLIIGFLAFAQEHEEHLPGSYWDSEYPPDANPDHRDWLRGNWKQFTSAPDGGTLFRYVGRQRGIYRCPSLDSTNPAATAFAGPGAGSNGRYDYVSIFAFDGANISAIHPTCQLMYPDGHAIFVPTPIVIEGDPAVVNGIQFRDWHAASDTLSHTHRRGSFYATIDTSVTWINEPSGGCWNWSAQTPSGKWVSLGNNPWSWGMWNRQ